MGVARLALVAGAACYVVVGSAPSPVPVLGRADDVVVVAGETTGIPVLRNDGAEGEADFCVRDLTRPAGSGNSGIRFHDQAATLGWLRAPPQKLIKTSPNCMFDQVRALVLERMFTAHSHCPRAHAPATTSSTPRAVCAV